MSRGHGAPGLLSNLRTFVDLIDDSQAARRAFLEYFPGIPTTPVQWVLSSGAAWMYDGSIAYSFVGQLLDVVGVDTSLGPLVRVESLADCISTAGTFFANTNIGAAASSLPHWDDGTLWDAAGVTWDHTATVDLFVHLPGDAAANTTTASIVPLLGLFIATRGSVHPQLGPDKLTNGGFESLIGWSQNVAPGWDDGATLWDGAVPWDSSPSSALDSVLFYGRGSTSSIKFVSGTATGFTARFQDLTTIVGATYRLSGYYRTDPAFSSNLSARIMVGDTTSVTVLYADGRDGDANGFAALTPTYGEWRRFLFDIVAPATTTRVQLRLSAPSVAGAGQLNFDGVSFKRVYRYNYYEPRLTSDSMPELTVAAQNIFFGGEAVGQGHISIADGDGVVAPLLALLLASGRPATLYVGGDFYDGQEIYRDDWGFGWPGVSQKVTATDTEVGFDADDARSLLNVMLPTRAHSLATEPNLNPNEGNSGRALLFHSSLTPVTKPARVDLTSNGYGGYEVADGAVSLAGVYSGSDSPVVTVFPNEELATKGALGVSISGALHTVGQTPPLTHIPLTVYTFDGATGRITVTKDVRNVLVARDGTDLRTRFCFPYDVGLGANSANVAVTGRTYMCAAQFVSEVAFQMNQVAGSGDITITYDEATHLVTVAKAVGTLSLKMSTGLNASLHGWELLGFNLDTDRTGALSYTADNKLFTSPEADHVLRVQAYGLKDDTAGNITGTPGAIVGGHAAVAKYVLYQFAKVPLIQLSGFTDVGGAAAQLVSVEQRQQISMTDFLTRLEMGGMAQIVVDVDGTFRWRPYAAGATSVASFFDRDYVGAFSVSQDPANNIFISARVDYGQNPGRQSSDPFEYVADSGIPTKYRRTEVLQVKTWIDSSAIGVAAAQLLAQRMARLAAANPRIASFSARGKLANVTVGDIVTLTRSRGYDSSGSLSAVRFRVVKMTHNFVAGVSACIAIEDVAFL